MPKTTDQHQSSARPAPQRYPMHRSSPCGSSSVIDGESGDVNEEADVGGGALVAEMNVGDSSSHGRADIPGEILGRRENCGSPASLPVQGTAGKTRSEEAEERGSAEATRERRGGREEQVIPCLPGEERQRPPALQKFVEALPCLPNGQEFDGEGGVREARLHLRGGIPANTKSGPRKRGQERR